MKRIEHSTFESASLGDPVEIHWVSANTAPLKKIISTALTEIQLIFTGYYRVWVAVISANAASANP